MRGCGRSPVSSTSRVSPHRAESITQIGREWLSGALAVVDEERCWCPQSECEPFNVVVGPPNRPVCRGTEDGGMSRLYVNVLDCYRVSVNSIMCARTDFSKTL